MIVVCTTFPSWSFDIYARKMLESFVQYWPADIALMVQTDDDVLYDQIDNILRPQDGLAIGWEKDHADFVARHKDDPHNYRHQPVRFCHKVFALKRALDSARKSKAAGGESPRYLIWMDADVLTIGNVDLTKCLPKDGDAAAYLGRKDWPHSECGWVAFDLENRGDEFIDTWHGLYTSDQILKLDEQHDSWAFDVIKNSKDAPTCTNLTEGKPGMDIWQHSPMAVWSKHYKGPVAKEELGAKRKTGEMKHKVIIQTQNAIPAENIREHIAENQKLIKHWAAECKANKEEIIVVSAGPQLIAEDLRNERRKIIAVKHALEPLKQAGVKPWACILLDPRDHVSDFVNDPDTDIIWFVASQVNPEVTRKLLLAGCKIMGYHASVGAGENELTAKQASAIIYGGSATATRGLFLLYHLGFRNFKLHGYDLCYPDKPDMNLKDDRGQPRYLEISLGTENSLYSMKKCFWTEPQLIAQFEEMNEIIKEKKFNIEAIGDGIIPFVLRLQRVSELRQNELRSKIGVKKLSSYRKLFRWNLQSILAISSKKMVLSTKWRKES